MTDIQAQDGANNPMFKGTVSIDDGYRRLQVGKSHPLADKRGRCYEHTLIWVSAGNKKPEKGKVIHHINGNKLDNRIDNLKLVTRSYHAKYHMDEGSAWAEHEQRKQFIEGDEYD